MSDKIAVTVSEEEAPASSTATAASTTDKGADTLLAGKYKTPGELEKAYKELEQRLGKPKEETPAKAETVAAPTTLEIPKPEAAPAALDLTEFTAELSKDGKLSDASLKKLAGRGISKDIAQVYVEGLKAQAAQFTSKMAERVGGNEELTKVLQWAGTSLSEAERTAVNASLRSGNEVQAGLALDALKMRYAAANGTDPQLVSGQAASRSSDGVQPYADDDEMVKDMSDKKYKTSEAFRKKVEARLAKGLDRGVSVRVVR